jgi:hypothetical protein
MNFELAERSSTLAEQDMVRTMILELTQADLKAIGRHRGLGAETVASMELMAHVFLSEQGVVSALAGLTSVELAGLHLLNCLHDRVDIEFFERIYPDAVSPNRYGSYTERFKGLFLRVKNQLIQRGLLLFGTLPDVLQRSASMLERRRFRFPEAFGALLPPTPVRPRQLEAAITGQHRAEILRGKVMELLQEASASKGHPGENSADGWRIERGVLRFGFGSGQFRVKDLEDWQKDRLQAAVCYANKAQPEALRPVPLVLYALSRLRGDEWLAPDELLPLWKLAHLGPKVPEPASVCEAGYDAGCIEKLELDGGTVYRLPRLTDKEAGNPFEAFLRTDNSQSVGIELDRVPLAALERLSEIGNVERAAGGLRATPNLLKLSHARSETLADPMLGWLRERHPAFRNTIENIEQRRGKLMVHQNLLVARVSDLALKVMLEKQFGEPGQLVGLSKQFVAFPIGLLPELQAWMKKSGHVIKTIRADEPVFDKGGPQ